MQSGSCFLSQPAAHSSLPGSPAPSLCLDSLSLNLESSYVFYLLAPECISDLVVLSIVMSFAPITVPGVQYSWSDRMKEFIFETKAQCVCESSTSG